MRVVSFDTIAKSKPKYLADQPEAVSFLQRKLARTKRRVNYNLFASGKRFGPAIEFTLSSHERPSNKRNQ
jgi:hypothetical protein